MDKDREQFEAWVIRRWPHSDLKHDGDGYARPFTQEHWESWQASGERYRKLLEECPWGITSGGLIVDKGNSAAKLLWLQRVAEMRKG